MPQQTFTDDKCQFNFNKERLWERSYLLAKCEELHLEEEFRLYHVRLWNSFLGVFCLLHTLITIVHCTILLLTCPHTHLILIDVCIYLVSAFIIVTVLSVNFCEKFASRHSWITYVSSVIAALTLVSADIFQGTYHYYTHDWALDTFYDTYIIYMIYMFMPIPLMSGALLLGVTVSVVYITYFAVYIATEYYFEIYSTYDYGRFIVDIFHHVCFNLLGMFFRTMNDIVVRSSFLDRHQYVMEKIWLRNARRQEKLVLHSIIPPQIAKPIQDDIQNRLARKGGGLRSPGVMEHIMAIQIHPEVSILYADVVNYTQLTTTLDVETLVRLLHGLFAKFDMAATHFKVQRIKFLGDCYYCVAGLMLPDPDHAKCCVDLGLSMISHIQQVRRENDVDIDMRIGVHSGSVIAGVIGEAKLQYDVWGIDVTIANRLESTGSAGYVHISASTLNELDPSQYTIMPGTDAASVDPLLIKHNINTFLISTESSTHFTKRSTEKFDSQSYIDMRSRPDLYSTNEDVINEELRQEFRKMPVNSFKPGRIFSLKRRDHSNDLLTSEVTKFCLVFRDSQLECKYLHSPDLMFKHSMLLAWIIGCSLTYIQLMTLNKNLRLSGLVLDFIILTCLTILLVIAWYKKLCFLSYGMNEEINHRFSGLSCRIFRTCEKIQGSLSLRICIYLFILCSYNSVVSVILMGCDREEFEMMSIESKLYHYDADVTMCFNPWVITNVVSLIISMGFTFANIPFILKIVVCFVLTLAYLIIIFFQFEFIFHHSATTNPFFAAEYAHSLLVVITFCTLYLKERHAEFTNKVNFNWRVELRRKQRDAHITNRSIIILLNNILPAHVVNVYLTSLSNHELYYEEYKIVSVMFATLKNFEMSLRSLRLLNEIITEFDRLLHHYKGNYLVEKIKIVGCTYMAACGLDVSFADRISKKSDNEDSNNRDSLMEEVQQAVMTRRASSTVSGQSHRENLHDEVVFVMATFALDLMRTLWMLNKAYETVSYDRTIISPDMSVGISSGEVMAGVVGASQPHYDIWGDPVNMASRMDSTGMIGHIQVTKETAIILREFGIVCNYRGKTYVKGPGKIPTYFVAIDNNYDFITVDAKRTPRRQHRQRIASLSDNESLAGYLGFDEEDSNKEN